MPLADLHNQYAWLVSNTEGDLQEALRASRRSLELSPDNPAYLDTLGRCYYALGDLENAIRFQSRAVQLEPSTQQIRRQLEFLSQRVGPAAKVVTAPLLRTRSPSVDRRPPHDRCLAECVAGWVSPFLTSAAR